MRNVVVVLAPLLVSACASSHVAPVAKVETKRICVIDNPRVRGDFIGAYRKALEGKGFEVQMLQQTEQPNACPLTSKYVAYFWWDMVFYMRQAEIDIYTDGKHAGRASFDAGMSRFFSTEEKVKELVDQLFPK